MRRVLTHLIAGVLLLLAMSPSHAETYEFVCMWGSCGTDTGQFGSDIGPVGLAIDESDNAIYVTDYGNQRIQKFSLPCGQFQCKWNVYYLSDIDFDGANYFYAVSSPGSLYKLQILPGCDVTVIWNISVPSGYWQTNVCVIDSNGNIHVLDSYYRWIHVYSPDGDSLYSYGESYLPTYPYHLGYHDGHIYVSDNSGPGTTGVIKIFTMSGAYIGEYLVLPEFARSIAFDSLGNLFAGCYDLKIRKFSPSLELLAEWGGGGSDTGLFSNIRDIEVASNGYVYVSDDSIATNCQGNRRIQVFRPAALDSLIIPLDIKPGSCPNPLNVRTPKTHQVDENPIASKSRPDGPPKPKAVLPVAILGTEDFDVTDIDPATVTLEGVPALRWNIEDVSTPVGEEAEECECNTLGADGYPDLTLKFDKGLIVEALGEVHDGDVVALTITGELSNGTAFEGTDCVVIRGDSQPADGFSPPEEEPPMAVLLGNYPNPFNPTTEISFSLPNAANVKLEVYNIMGQQVATIVDRFMEAGTHSATFDSRDGSGRPVASGIYFYRLKVGEFVETKKMVLLK